jgi:hypothetical protein
VPDRLAVQVNPARHRSGCEQHPPGQEAPSPQCQNTWPARNDPDVAIDRPPAIHLN